MFKTLAFLIRVFVFLILNEKKYWKVKALTKENKIAEKDALLEKTAKSFADVVLSAARLELVVEGAENLPPKGTPVVFTPNHGSYFDIPIMIAAVPGIVGFVSKPENAKIPFIGKWIKESYSVYIDRSSAANAIEGLRSGAEILKRGHRQVIFPEGTRSRDGKLQSFKPGSYKLAKMSNSLVIPVAICGAHQIVQKSGKINTLTIRVKFFKALDSNLNTVEMARNAETSISEYVEKYI